MLAPFFMDVDNVFDLSPSVIRRKLERDELSYKVSKIDVDVMTAKPLLVNVIDYVRAICRKLNVGSSIRFQMWGDGVNGRKFIATILNVFKVNLRNR